MNWRRWIFRGVNGLLAPLFLFFAVVQVNDPDPARWMALYLAAALSCALELTGRLRWPLPALVALAAGIWAGIWAPGVVGKVDWGHALAGAGMDADPRGEEARELLGLCIVAAWCAVLALASLSRGRAASQKG